MPHAANLLDKLKDVSFDPGRQYSLTWQSGFAGIGYDKAKVGRDLKTIDDLWAARPQGQDRGPQRVPRHPRPDHAEPGRRPLRPVHRGPVRGGRRRGRASGSRTATSGGSRATPTCRTCRAATPSPASSGAATSSSCGPRPRTQLAVRAARVRRHAVERQHDGPDHRRAPAQRRAAHGLLLPAGGRGPGRGVRQLRLPRAGCPGRDGEDRPRAGQEPVHLPDGVLPGQEHQGVPGAQSRRGSQDYGATWAKVVGN